jgi:outer membrane protein assembly factor BamB
MSDYHPDPDDDFEVEITALDGEEKSNSSPSISILHGSHLSRRTRVWLSIISGLAAILLIVVALHPTLPVAPASSQAAPTPLPTDPPSFSGPPYVSVMNGTVYAITTDQVLHALSADDGFPVWQHRAYSLPPTIINGVVYLWDLGAQDSIIYALQASDGTRLWSRHLPPQSFIVLIGEDGSAYTISNALSSGHMLFALRASDGARLWQHTIPSLFSSVQVRTVQGQIYVNTLSHTALSLLSVLRGRDGSLLWQYYYASGETQSVDGSGITADVTVEHGMVYIGNQDGSIRALRDSDGVQVWDYTASVDGAWSAITQDGTIYVNAADGSVKALRGNDGSQIWDYKDGGAILNRPQVIEGVVYLRTGGGAIDAVRASDGKRLWRYSSSSHFTYLVTAINGIAYISSIKDLNSSVLAHTLDAIRISDGAVLWRHALNGTMTPFPSLLRVFGAITYVDEGDNSLAALSTGDGSVLWRLNFPTSSLESLSVSGDTAYIPTPYGTLEARRASTGALLWSYPPLAKKGGGGAQEK